MKDMQPDINNYSEEDSIDIIALLKKIWEGRKLIITSVATFFIVGGIVALLSPVVYTSETIFVPQTSEDKTPSSKGLGSLAGLVGIDLNAVGSTSESYLSPLLYTKISDSEEFSIDLLDETLVSMEGETLTIKDYLSKDEGGFNLIGSIKGLFSSDNPERASLNPALDAYNFISGEDFGMIGNLQTKFSVEINDKEGFIKVIATDENAFISSQIVSLVTKKLQSKIIALRTNKIKERLDYSKEQYDLKRSEFENLQNRVAKFKDANKNISTALFLSRLEKLESEYNLQQSILMGLANEYNGNKIKLNKDTPIFSVIDEVSVPIERSAPKRTQIVMIWVFLGFILVVAYILAKSSVIRLIDELKGNS